MPAGWIAFQIVLYVVGVVAGVAQARRARREAEAARADAAAVDLRSSGSGRPIPVVYGYAGVEGIGVYRNAGIQFTRPTGGGLGTLSTGRYRNRQQYALVQYVLSLGELHRLRDVVVNNNTRPDADFRDTQFLQMYFNEPADPTFALEFRGDNAAARFTGITHGAGVFQIRRSNPEYYGEPTTFWIVEGRVLPRLVQDMDGTVRVDGTEYGRDAPSVLLDYLTSSSYGPGLSHDDIDLNSFRVARDLARATVVSGFWTVGTDLLRYEFNGVLPTTRDFTEAIQRILAVMPGAALFRAHDSGKFKLVLPGSQNQTGLVFGDSQLTRAVRVTRPGPDNALNRVSASFANARLSFAEGTAIYPEEGSVVADQLSDLDGGVVNSTQIDLNGVNNLPQANSVCYSVLQTSRRKRYEFDMLPSGLLLEPGDIVRVQDSTVGVDDMVMVTGAEVRENFAVRIQGLQFVETDYAWNPGSDEVIQQGPVINRELGVPSLVQVVHESEREIQLTLTEAANESPWVALYEVEYRQGDDWFGWVRSDATSFRFNVPSGGGSFAFRARSVSQLGRVSPWSEATATTTFAAGGAGGADGVGVERIYAKSSVSSIVLPARTITTTLAGTGVNQGQQRFGPERIRFGVAGLFGFNLPVDWVEDGLSARILHIEIDNFGGLGYRIDMPIYEFGEEGTGDSYDPGPRLIAAVRSGVTIRLTNGSNVLNLNGITDSTEPYQWVPTNQAEVAAFVAAFVQFAPSTVELIFAGATVSPVAAPDNSWGYNTRPVPGTAVGVWYSSAPNLSTGELLWNSEREVVGRPAAGTAVPALWTSPVRIGGVGTDGQNGADGQDGAPGADGSDGRDGTDGADGRDGAPGAAGQAGADGNGVEFAFRATSSGTVAPIPPTAAALYDQPNNGWADAVPATTPTTPFIWWTKRAVDGTPAVGAIVNRSWDTPRLLARPGDDGQDGSDGQDGAQGPPGPPAISIIANPLAVAIPSVGETRDVFVIVSGISTTPVFATYRIGWQNNLLTGGVPTVSRMGSQSGSGTINFQRVGEITAGVQGRSPYVRFTYTRAGNSSPEPAAVDVGVMRPGATTWMGPSFPLP